MAINLNIQLDTFNVVNAISDAVNPDQDRGAFTQNLATATSSALLSAVGRRFNVMVFNTQQGFSFSFAGEVFAATCQQQVPFAVWAFQSGSFDNRGDGGFINWCFEGLFNRNGNHVDFFDPGAQLVDRPVTA